ncbi:MAG: CRISPR-associated protein Cas4 [Thermoanaerobacteraceae bacterium]|nr:CRISPR-associated protein Cas4 [Thermoanaerobacteraceae bacterium]
MFLNIIFSIFVFYVLIQAIYEKRPVYRQMNRVIGFKRAKLLYIDKQEEVKRRNVIYGKLLRSEKYGISGKPDYIYELGSELIPLELKSTKVDDNSPLFKDVMQLAAYFLIIEEVFGKKVIRGRIIYQNTMFEIYNRKKVRKDLMKIIKNMRLMENGKYDPEERGSFIKCRFCPCRGTVCKIYEEDGKVND